jgi:hypothetical protein
MFSIIRPDFEVVKEGRISHFVSGNRRFKLVALGYDKMSSLVEKTSELSVLSLIKDLVRFIRLE